MKAAVTAFAGVMLLAAPAALAQLNLTVSGDAEKKVALKGTVMIDGDDVPALRKARATITGNVVEMSVPGSAGAHPVVLTGAIIKSELTRTKFTGYMAVSDHPFLAEVDDPNVEELIEVEGGQVIKGRITQISAAGATIGDRTIPLDKISRICSPTIFQFVARLSTTEEPGEGGRLTASATAMQLERTTSVDKSKGKSGTGKRCCQFPPLTAPVQKKKEGGGHHIHIIIPI